MKEKMSNVLLIGILILVLFIAGTITSTDKTNLFTKVLIYFSFIYKPLVIILLVILIIVIIKKKKN